MKKKISICAAAAMVALFSMTVQAEGLISSPAQKGAELAGGVTLTTESGVVTVLDDGTIRITNVEDTLSGESGLEDRVNAVTNAVYDAATQAETTSSFLSLFANGEEIQTMLNEQLMSADASAADSLDDYEAAALFDVSIDDTALQTMTEGSNVQIPVKVDGITTTSDVLALHFIAAEGEESVNSMEVEVLPCVANDGFVTITMTSFSPVMVLTRVQSDLTVTQEGSAESAVTENSDSQPQMEDETEQSDSENSNSHAGIYIGGAVVVVVLVGAFYVATRKKKTTTSNKK